MKILDIIYQDKGFIKIKAHSQKEIKEAHKDLVMLNLALEKSKELLKEFDSLGLNTKGLKND